VIAKKGLKTPLILKRRKPSCLLFYKQLDFLSTYLPTGILSKNSEALETMT